KAARRVAQAIEHADPSVREMAAALAKDFAVLRDWVQTEADGEAATIISNAKKTDSPVRLKKLMEIQDKAASSRDAAISASSAEAREAAMKAAAQFDELAALETASERYREYRAALAAIEKRAAVHTEALDAAAAAILAWAASHSDLARAAESGLSPDFSVLAELTKDLFEAYQKVRKS